MLWRKQRGLGLCSNFPNWSLVFLRGRSLPIVEFLKTEMCRRCVLKSASAISFIKNRNSRIIRPYKNWRPGFRKWLQDFETRLIGTRDSKNAVTDHFHKYVPHDKRNTFSFCIFFYDVGGKKYYFAVWNFFLFVSWTFYIFGLGTLTNVKPLIESIIPLYRSGIWILMTEIKTESEMCGNQKSG